MPVRAAWAAMVLSLLFHYAGQNARAGERYEAVLLDCKANFYVSHIVWVIGKSHTGTSQNCVPHSDEQHQVDHFVAIRSHRYRGLNQIMVHPRMSTIGMSVLREQHSSDWNSPPHSNDKPSLCLFKRSIYGQRFELGPNVLRGGFPKVFYRDLQMKFHAGFQEASGVNQADRFDGKPWPLIHDEAFPTNLITLSSYVDCLFSVHHGASGGCPQQICKEPEPRCGQKQAARTEREYPRPYSDPPFVRRFLEALPFIPASLGFFVLAWFRFSRGREMAGWAFIVSGCLAFCAGAAIIMLTLNPETWEWGV